MNHKTPSERRRIYVAISCVCLAAAGFAQTKPAPAPAAMPRAEEAVVLSPFVVDASSEQGYLATQTLNGTRFNTSLRDIGSAMTIFTEEMMSDLAATSINDVLAFAPNTDTFFNRTSANDAVGNDFLNNAVQYVTRGNTTNIVGQNFFANGVPPDNYNSEAYTFTRGPNAILFGLGNPAGAFVSATKRATSKNAYAIEFRTDSNGTIRTSVDINRVLLVQRLSLRYAGLYEESKGFRDPSDGFQRRHFVTATYSPFSKTSIRLNYERGRSEVMAIRPWPVIDGVSQWLAAGSPLLDNVGGALKTGIVRTGYTTDFLVTTQWSRTGTQVAPMNWRNQARTTDLAYPTFPNLGNIRSVIDESIFPTKANVIGAGSSRKQNFTNATALIEQQLGPNLFIEAAVNKSTTDLTALNSFIANFNILRVDVNRQLPNGQPNPNVGTYYVESYSGIIDAPGDSLTRRAMLSYELDLSRKMGRWGNLLGRHRLAAFYEDNNANSFNNGRNGYNVTPLSGFPADITNVTNRVNFRYYLDPAHGIVTAGRDSSSAPTVYAGTPLPATDPSGVTFAYLPINGGIAQVTSLWTRALALQSSFWQGRIVLTAGSREDARAIYRMQTTDFLPYRDARLLYPDPTKFDAKAEKPGSRQNGEGQTFTRGAVFHAFSWLSLTYNHSNNFQPSTNRSISGDLLPNPQGDGSDYGIRFSLLGGRIVSDLTYYENFTRDRADNTISGGAGGISVKGQVDPLWQTISAYVNDAKYLAFPYSDAGSTWQDATTSMSRGYEFSVTTNITPSWRFTVNGSKRSNGATTERARFTKEYLNYWIPQWKANPSWMSLSGPAGSASSDTVAHRVQNLETVIKNFDAIASLPDDAFAPQWGVNLVTSYSFTQRLLKGISLGGSMNMRGSSIAGFAETTGNVIDPTHPYYVGGYKTIGAWLTDQRRLFKNKVAWRAQLNIRNLLDENTLTPLKFLDKRDGTHDPIAAQYRLSDPRTYVLTSSFKF